MLRRLRRKAGSVGDFNVFLHGLRSRELERLPGGARTVLHGGCAGSWYFDWFAECYPTVVERHIGVEAFAERPPELDDRVEWLQRSLGDLGPVGDGDVDLVFAGQVIEHLWPEEVSGFLLESHRVLRPGGLLAADSPNRRVTTAIGWEHPEHTVEFRPDEVLELFELAGFEQAQVRGVWLCFDRERNRFLPLDGDQRPWPAERRASAAGERAQDSFVWWIEATRGDVEPDSVRLARRVDEIYQGYRRFRFSRLKHTVGAVSGVGRDRLVTAGAGETGYLVSGPFVPMRPGRRLTRFRVAAGPGAATRSFGLLEIVVGHEAEPVARMELTPEVISLDGGLREVVVEFELPRTELSVQFRVETYGAVPMSALLHVDVEPEGPPVRAASDGRLESATA